MKSFNDKIIEQLDPTERLLFCKALKCYETKEFKKGLKLCTSVLSTAKGANHAETLALKGIFMSCTGHHDEGYNLCKQGIAKDLNSYMCWHILGLVERDRRNYASSLACFKTASKKNPTNIQILRDLGNLQLQQGDLLGNMETREKLYQLQPNYTTNTIAYAYGCYLCKEYQKSFEILKNAEQSHTTFHSQLSKQELSNLLQFEAELMLRMNRFNEMEQFIGKFEEKFLDKENLLILLAVANERNNKHDIAAEKYLQLLLLMPDNDEYVDKYVENFIKINSVSKTLSSNKKLLEQDLNNRDNIESLKDDNVCDDNTSRCNFSNIDRNAIRFQSEKLIYKSLTEYIPNSLLLKQRYMNLASLDEFDRIVDDYLNLSLEKSVPQAINILRHVYENDVDGKIDIVQEKLIKLIELNHSKVQTLQWCHYYLATHYKLLDCLDQSLASLKECLKLNPSMHDAIILMAKIYRSVDNFDCANHVMRVVSDMVPSDRYMNSITGKYFFYVNNYEIADRYLQRFSRNEQSIDDYMREVQNLWYRIHKASLFYREKKYFDALFHIRIAECHFEQFTFDKIDFHSYCIRKWSLNAHERLLHHDESLRFSKFYYRFICIAAKTLINIYRQVSSDNVNNDIIYSNKKKKAERHKKLKEIKKENRQNGEILSNTIVKSTENPATSSKKQLNCCPKRHTIDNPEKLKDFYMNKSNLPKLINELNNFATLLHNNFNNKFQSQSILYEIYITIGNYEKLLESYRQMIAIQPNHFKLFWYECRMLKYFSENIDDISLNVKNELLSILPITDFKDFKYKTYVSIKLADYLKKYHQNPWNMVTYILVATCLDISTFIEPTATTLLELLKNEPDIFTYTEMTKFRKFVRKYLPDRLDALDFIIRDWYPTIFHSKEIVNCFQ